MENVIAIMKTVSFKGKTMHLVGRSVQAGDLAPDFRVISGDLSESRLDHFEGKVKLITLFPSLDTSVCSKQVKEFNERAKGLSGEVVVLAVSKDLPFAQERFCESFKMTHIKLLSDYRHSSLGVNYGLLVKELNLLARAVLIVDKSDVIRYLQVVDELTQEPNYDEAMKALNGVLQNPVSEIKEKAIGRCRACEGETEPLSADIVQELVQHFPEWHLVDGRKIERVFKFKDFAEANCFLELVAVLAEDQNHHPTLTLDYGRVGVSLSTHKVDGLTDNDFVLAEKIGELKG